MLQKDALEIMTLGNNVFLTGPPGTGKTYLLNQFIQYKREQGETIGVTASTGIAATHLGGVTIHSWSGIGVRDSISKEKLKEFRRKTYLTTRLLSTTILVIDEISMLDANKLDLIDRVCRFMKKSDDPFGGLQVVLVGDFFQLPPVGREGKKPPYCFHSKAWKELDLKVCYLHQQFRQQDKELPEVLEAIRNNSITTLHHKALQARNKKPIEGIPSLFTHNVDVDRLNSKELEKLEGVSQSYLMTSQGKDALVSMLKSNCLAPEILELKIGAPVVFLKNNYNEGYVNGSLGTVTRFHTDGSPAVRLLTGQEVTVQRETWAIEEDDKVVASVSQIPLRLAWAITIHKSQGMTLDAAEIDLSKSFISGMGYVALSRVKSMEGVYLKGFNELALQSDPKIVDFDKELRKASKKVEVEICDA